MKLSNFIPGFIKGFFVKPKRENITSQPDKPPSAYGELQSYGYSDIDIKEQQQRLEEFELKQQKHLFQKIASENLELEQQELLFQEIASKNAEADFLTVYYNSLVSDSLETEAPSIDKKVIPQARELEKQLLNLIKDSKLNFNDKTFDQPIAALLTTLNIYSYGKTTQYKHGAPASELLPAQGAVFGHVILSLETVLHAYDAELNKVTDIKRHEILEVKISYLKKALEDVKNLQQGLVDSLSSNNDKKHKPK